MYITDRDIYIIRLLDHFRLLTTTQIVSLLGAHPQAIYRRLSKLVQNGYIYRERYHSRRPYINAIGNAGADLLRERYGIRRRRIDYTQANRKLTDGFIDHTILVGEIVANFADACKKTGGMSFVSPVEICDSMPDDIKEKRKKERLKPLSWRVNVMVKDVFQTLTITSDTMFGIRKNTTRTNGKTSYFFVEADRATEPNFSLDVTKPTPYKKMLVYHKAFREAHHKTHFGIGNFRVLFVTSTGYSGKKRIGGFLKTNEKATKNGSRLFVFMTTENLSPENIKNSRFQNGKGERIHLTV